MEKLTAFNRNCTAALSVLLLLTSCNTKKSTPFPGDGDGNTIPVSKPLVFSETKLLLWKDISPDSIKPTSTVALDINKLPAKPFTLNDFKPFKNPIQQRKLNWDDIPDSSVNFDTLPSKPFRLQQSILPKPVSVRAGRPKIMQGTTSGILQFGEEEGLPGLTVNASLVDNNGTIWFSTNKGLCRYTGDFLYVYSFTNKTAQGSDYAITNMAKDDSGRIWMTTNGDGIYVMDLYKGALYHDNSQMYAITITCSHDGTVWLNAFKNNGSVINIIDTKKQTVKEIQNPEYGVAIKEDRYHNIWIGNRESINIISADRKKIKKITAKEGLITEMSLEFFEDSKGDMWIASFAREINIISLKNNTISSINAYNGFTGLAAEITEDRQGKIWAIRRDTMYVFNRELTAFKSFNVNISMVQLLKGTSLTDTHGNIWIGTLDKGILIIDPEGPLPEHLDTRNGLSDFNVWGVMESSDSNIWLGTYNGINIYDPVKNQLKVAGKELGEGGGRVSRMMEYNKDSVIAITQKGFRIIDRRQNKVFNYASNYLDKYGVFSCTKDKQNHLWFAAAKGLLQIDLHTNTAKQFGRSSGLPSNLLWTIATDHQGNIWAGTDSGVAIINPADNRVKLLRESEGLCNNQVMKIVPVKNGEVWVATQKGISIIDIKKNSITNLTSTEGLLPDAVYDLLESNNVMYAGSSDGMIAITNTGSAATGESKWNFVNYGKKEGFPFNDYNQDAGTAARNGQLWWGVTPVLTVVTQPVVKDTFAPVVNISGINVMDATTSPFAFFSYKELAGKINSSDTIWNDTKTKYYLHNSLPKDSGYVFENNIHWDSTITIFKLPAGLSLPYNQNSLSFAFSNNDIRGRDKIAYCYILEGAENKWSAVSERPLSKNYYNLAPGTYRFRVCSRGFNGIWGSPAEFSFTIRPPWWQTWWAYILYAVTLGTVIWSFAQYRSARLQKENRLLEEKVTQRTAQLNTSLQELKSTQTQLIQSEKMASLGELTAGIAHEIQNPLNFVNNFSEVSNELIDEMKDELSKGNYEDAKEIADDVKQNLEKINHHGKRADAIVKGMLQHTRTSSGQKELTDINALCDEYLRLAYHGLRAKDKSFNAAFKTDFDNTIQKINVIPQDIGRVILNLINNAFYAVSERKNASALRQAQGSAAQPYEPIVSVSTKKIHSHIEIKVADNGNGIPKKVLDKIFQPFFTTKPTGQGTGLGLSLSYDIVKAHGGELKVETKEGEGSVFQILLPINHS